MSTRAPDPAAAAIELVARIVSGSSTADDLVRLCAACQARVLGEAESIEAALGLRTGWEKNVRSKVSDAISADQLAASEWRAILDSYLRRHFATDRLDPSMVPIDRAVKYQMAVRFKGRVPSLRTMQRYLGGR